MEQFEGEPGCGEGLEDIADAGDGLQEAEDDLLLEAGDAGTPELSPSLEDGHDESDTLLEEARVVDAPDDSPADAEGRLSEDGRLDIAAERLRQVEGLQPDRWQHMDQCERRAALDRVGRELGQAYWHPNPPVTFVERDDPALAAEYGDGYQVDQRSGQVGGSDYGIRINAAAEARQDRPLGDDLAEALRTYAHEWRHSYQAEQARMYEKQQFLHLVDALASAREWADNFRDYRAPEADHEAYRDQPVEVDAERFADKMVRLLLDREPLKG